MRKGREGGRKGRKGREGGRGGREGGRGGREGGRGEGEREFQGWRVRWKEGKRRVEGRQE